MGHWLDKAATALESLVWRLELEITSSCTRKQLQTAFATKDRVAWKFMALSGGCTWSNANIREMWVPQTFRGSLPWAPDHSNLAPSEPL